MFTDSWSFRWTLLTKGKWMFIVRKWHLLWWVFDIHHHEVQRQDFVDRVRYKSPFLKTKRKAKAVEWCQVQREVWLQYWMDGSPSMGSFRWWRWIPKVSVWCDGNSFPNLTIFDKSVDFVCFLKYHCIRWTRSMTDFTTLYVSQVPNLFSICKGC